MTHSGGPRTIVADLLFIYKKVGFIEYIWPQSGNFLYLLFAVTAASAQDKGNWALGPRMNIYTNTGDAVVGLGAFGRYSFTDNWRIEPSLMALLHSGCSIDISVDAQYVFHLGEGWSVYPAVGFTANDIGKWAAGLNIGGGFDFEVARNWDLSAGLKWQPMFDDWRKNPVVISIGAAYKF